MMTIPERRRIERRPFSYYMPVSDFATSQQAGVMTDISLGGFKLDSRQPIPSGRVHRFRLNLTSDVGPKAFLELTGRSKWCKPDTLYPSIYNIGYEITKISPEDRPILQRLFEQYGSQQAVGEI